MPQRRQHGRGARRAANFLVFLKENLLWVPQHIFSILPATAIMSPFHLNLENRIRHSERESPLQLISA
jgi:hypothetical protein